MIYGEVVCVWIRPGHAIDSAVAPVATIKHGKYDSDHADQTSDCAANDSSQRKTEHKMLVKYTVREWTVTNRDV